MIDTNRKFALLHPDTEIIGQMVIDLDNAVNNDYFAPILQKHGLDKVQPNDWYPARKWLDILEEVVEESSYINLVSIGIQQIKNVQWPPEFYELSFDEVLKSINPIYQAHCKGTDTGEIEVECISENHYRISLRVFEPDNLWYGNLHQIVKTFANDRPFVLVYEDEGMRRDYGGERTVLNLIFEE